MADIDEYVARARAAVLAILDTEHAVVHAELEARIAEAAHSGDHKNIDPHHITTAIRDLRDSGRIQWAEHATRGGRTVSTIQPADPGRRATKIAAAAARKRLLLTRYNSWAQGTKRHPHGLIGPAGEQALRGAILASGALQPASAGAGEVKSLLGVTLPGSLDSAGYLVPLDPRGIPQPPLTVLFEVKNLRTWIYPNARELYQLLHKAVLIQEANPDQPIVPVFVCRKAQKTTFWMAQQLGFIAIDMGIQFAGDVGEEELMEVRTELRFLDLARGSGPSLRIQDRLKGALPRHGPSVAAQWAETCGDSGATRLIGKLRRSSSSEHEGLVAELRRVNTRLGRRGGW